MKKRGGHVTLLAFYIFCRPEERVQNLFAFDTKKAAETAIKKFEDDAKKKALKQKQEEDEVKRQKALAAQKKIYSNVFGKDNFDPETGELKFSRPEGRKDYTAPNEGKHRTREALMKLKKDFNHELVLRNMLKVELADDRIFKYPDEYQLFDDAKEKGMKANFVSAALA